MLQMNGRNDMYTARHTASLPASASNKCGPQDGPDDEADRYYAMLDAALKEVMADRDWIEDYVASEFLGRYGRTGCLDALDALVDMWTLYERALRRDPVRVQDEQRAHEIYRLIHDWISKRDGMVEDEAEDRLGAREDVS